MKKLKWVDTASKKDQDTILYLEQILTEDREVWKERYYELEKLQKATYTAAKKSTAILTEQIEIVLSRLESLENNFNSAWQVITELQKKSLDGQKKALSIEINHMKDNMSHLQDIIKEENGLDDIRKNIEHIINLLDKDKNYLSSETGISTREPISEAVDYSINNNVKVTPLYDNPNQNLTPEEIASLFASAENNNL